MFGYVRPFRPELRCREFDLYRATYCGLCRTMRRRYGLIAPMFLTYDFTFLSLLLCDPEEDFVPCTGRCHANPLIKKTMVREDASLALAADTGVILAYWKLRDSAKDDRGLKRLGAGLLALVMRGPYKKAAALRPEFDGAVRARLAELGALEEENCPSLDRPADTFARILQAACPKLESEGRRRALEQLLYHLGRFIYLLDAQDDLEEDGAGGGYNPVALRFGPQGDDRQMEQTLGHSLNLMRSAFHLEEFGCRAGLLENILYLGLPLVQRAVFDGSWKELRKQKIYK